MHGKARQQTCADTAEARQETIRGLPCTVMAPDGGRSGVLLLLHGLGGSRDFLLPHYASLRGAGLLVLAADAPFHGARFGDEAKRLMARGITAFLYRAVLDWTEEVRGLLRAFDGDPVGVVGFSMGAFVAHALAASEPSLRAVVAHSGCGCWRERESRRGTRLPPGLDAMVVDHDPRSRRAGYPPTPLLLTHGGRDAVVDPALAELDLTELRDAYAAVPGRLTALRVDGTGHEITAQAAQAGVDWLCRWLPVLPPEQRTGRDVNGQWR